MEDPLYVLQYVILMWLPPFTKVIDPDSIVATKIKSWMVSNKLGHRFEKNLSVVKSRKLNAFAVLESCSGENYSWERKIRSTLFLSAALSWNMSSSFSYLAHSGHFCSARLHSGGSLSQSELTGSWLGQNWVLVLLIWRKSAAFDL